MYECLCIVCRFCINLNSLPLRIEHTQRASDYVSYQWTGIGLLWLIFSTEITIQPYLHTTAAHNKIMESCLLVLKEGRFCLATNMQPHFFPPGKRIKRSTQDAPSTRTTMDRPLLRIPCTTQTQKLLRGKLSALTPISTPSAPWFDVCWIWEKHRGRIQLRLVCLTWIYIDIYIFPVSDKIQQRHRIAQKHKAHFQKHLTADRIQNLKD